MKYLIIIILLVSAAVYGYFNFIKPSATPVSTKSESISLTDSQAVDKVKSLKEVRDYLTKVPGAIVDVDNDDRESYNVHVYEIKDGHTATFNWYAVDKTSGDVKGEFPIDEQSSDEQSTGTVSGKLAYPSEVLPEGLIEAKRISDGKIFTLKYPGSTNGGGQTYSFELEAGEYYLRYKVAENLIGYSTADCPTGNETTCGSTEKRILTKAFIEPDGTVSNYNLADFYYTDANKPDF
ncbi:MAG TPA: hypothetical protein VIK81_03060 [Patescibacteria group bacterium]